MQIANNQEQKTKSFAENSFFFFVTKVGIFVLSFITSIIIARTLGPAGKGAATLIILVPVLLSQVINLGLHQSNIYFLGKKKENFQEILENSSFFILTVGLISATILWFLRTNIASLLSLKEYQTVIGIATLLIPLTLSFNIYSNILLGQKRFKERNLVQIIYSTSYLFFVFILVYIFHFWVLGVIISVIIANLISITINLWLIKKNGYSFLPNLNLKLLKESIAYGVKSQLGNVLQFFNYRLDMFLVGFFLGTASVGIYAISVGMAELLWFIPTSMGTILFPMVADEMQEKSDQFISLICRQTLFLVMIVAFILFSISKFVIPFFYGKQFLAAIMPFNILLPGIILIGVHKVLIFALMGKGYPQYMSYSSAIALFVTLGLDFILIPRLGVTGAALASTLAYASCSFYTASRFKKISKLKWREFLLPQSQDFKIYRHLAYKLIKTSFWSKS